MQALVSTKWNDRLPDQSVRISIIQAGIRTLSGLSWFGLRLEEMELVENDNDISKRRDCRDGDVCSCWRE